SQAQDVSQGLPLPSRVVSSSSGSSEACAGHDEALEGPLGGATVAEDGGTTTASPATIGPPRESSPPCIAAHDQSRPATVAPRGRSPQRLCVAPRARTRDTKPTGTTKSYSTTDAARPPTTATAKAWLAAVPCSWAMAVGTRPTMVAGLVMTIGTKRRPAACTAASRGG